MTVPQKHYTVLPFSPEASYSSHSSLCQNFLQFISIFCCWANKMEQPFSEQQCYRRPRDSLFNRLWLGVCLWPIPESLFIFSFGPELRWHLCSRISRSFPVHLVSALDIPSPGGGALFKLTLNFSSAHTVCHLMTEAFLNHWCIQQCLRKSTQLWASNPKWADSEIQNCDIPKAKTH